ncbi:exodeoxyribonuclease VII large subunit [Oceaniovalibus guishaninsula]|nr:exodeoxyribonuclease VII large subunit [Oceaniovalibus guishaninsula]
MDLIDDPAPGQNAPEFTVSEISGAVKRVIEGEFGRVRVRGEVGRVSHARSGHLYFDVKDDRNLLACVAWKGQVAALTAMPEEGAEVVVTGRLTTFGSQSKYQMNVDGLRPAGVGALMAMLEKRRAQFQAEGLFDPAAKRPLPFLPRVIGVVTSPTGAVIRDILHRLRDRFPSRVLVWPVAVQGRACAPEVAAAIAGFNALPPDGPIPRPDLLIVARGGGSVEDLWGFNEEIVVRAAFAGTIPLISAVGHETDTSLLDHAADRRAPTPSAAAEMAVPVRLDLVAQTDALGARLTRALGQGVARRRDRLRDLSRALPRADTLTAQGRQRLDLAERRLDAALAAGQAARRARLAERSAHLRPSGLMQRLVACDRTAAGLGARLAPGLRRALDLRAARLAERSDRLRPDALRRDIARHRDTLSRQVARLAAAQSARLERGGRQLEALDRLRLSLGYEATLQRGYAVVRAGDAVVTTRAAAEAAAAPLEIQFRDGRMTPGARRRRKQTPPPPDQGTLL